MKILILLLTLAFTLSAQQKLRILAIGAHPDDCDIKFGGTAALFAQMGHVVKFLSITNGDAGHHEMGGDYAATLRLWRERYCSRRASISRLGFDEVFHRMWIFYLAYSEAGFRSGYLNVRQFILERGRS